MSDTEKNVEKLIERAATEKEPLAAMQLAQAALNAGNALCVLATARQQADKN